MLDGRAKEAPGEHTWQQVFREEQLPQLRNRRSYSKPQRRGEEETTENLLGEHAPIDEVQGI